MSSRGFVLPLVLALAAMTSPARAGDRAPVFKIYVEHNGVYEVSFERLSDAGLGEPMPTSSIGLRNFGEPVPVWVEDGGDGLFGPGDRILFVGEALRGEYSYLDPYSRLNCYVLDFSDPAPWAGLSRTQRG